MTTLYKDALIEITEAQIVLHRFYFPSKRDRSVLLTDVESIKLVSPSLVGYYRWRLWGTNDFRTWLPEDYRRPKRDVIFILSLRASERRAPFINRFIGLLTGESYRSIGFTVEDSQKVRSILHGKGLLN